MFQKAHKHYAIPLTLSFSQMQTNALLKHSFTVKVINEGRNYPRVQNMLFNAVKLIILKQGWFCPSQTAEVLNLKKKKKNFKNGVLKPSKGFWPNHLH